MAKSTWTREQRIRTCEHVTLMLARVRRGCHSHIRQMDVKRKQRADEQQRRYNDHDQRLHIQYVRLNCSTNTEM